MSRFRPMILIFWSYISVMAAVGFSAGQGFGAGSYPHALAVGDFNEDGKVDLAVAASSTPDYRGGDSAQ